MASRRYITNSAPSYTPTTIRGAWDQSTGDGMGVPATRALAIAPAGAAAALAMQETSTTTNWDVLIGRWMTDPVTGGSLSGTVTWAIGCAENDVTANMFFHVHVYVTIGDSGSVRGTLLIDDIGATEWSTTPTARSEGAKTIGTTTLVSGDRVVFELGYRAQNTTGSPRAGEIYCGNTGTPDLAVADSGNLVIERPAWVEFSDPSNVLAVLTPGTPWYAHYDTTSGELLSLGTVLPDPVPSGTAILELATQPNLFLYVWDTTLREFVIRDPGTAIDRVEDLAADASLSAVWADLDATQTTALKSRLGQILGPYRTRRDFQPVDLEEGQPEIGN